MLAEYGLGALDPLSMIFGSVATAGANVFDTLEASKMQNEMVKAQLEMQKLQAKQAAQQAGVQTQIEAESSKRLMAALAIGGAVVVGGIILLQMRKGKKK